MLGRVTSALAMAGRFTPKKSDAHRGADLPAKSTTGSSAGADAGRAKPAAAASSAARAKAANHGRYTPPLPPPVAEKPTGVWVMPVMFGTFTIGVLSIVLNYLEVLPGAPSNVWLLVGLAFVVAGFLAATQLR